MLRRTCSSAPGFAHSQVSRWSLLVHTALSLERSGRPQRTVNCQLIRALRLRACYALATRGLRRGSRLLCMTAPTGASAQPLCCHSCPCGRQRSSALQSHSHRQCCVVPIICICLCRSSLSVSLDAHSYFTWEHGAARFNGSESQLKSQVNSRVRQGRGAFVAAIRFLCPRSNSIPLCSNLISHLTFSIPLGLCSPLS